MKRVLTLLSALMLCLGLTTCAYAEEPEPDYLALMKEAAVNGDREAGLAAEETRNAMIDESGSDEIKISFDELFLLSKLIYSEAGSDWLSDELRFCVGEVVMNRVASSEFPNSIEEVIYQEGQYDKVCTEEFRFYTLPSASCVDAAARLLLGERMMEPQVVFQSNSRIGEVYSIYCDRRLGYTYFCESPNGELYNEEEAPQEESAQAVPLSAEARLEDAVK